MEVKFTDSELDGNLKNLGWEGDVTIDVPFPGDRGEMTLKFNAEMAKAEVGLKETFGSSEEKIAEEYINYRAAKLAKIGQQHLKAVNLKHIESGVHFTDHGKLMCTHGSYGLVIMVGRIVISGAPLGKS